ncbi:TPA: hypothetical protein N0F65_008150 [Lagenidium giganteum]|uniref:HTH CENPB-type domain-containing protein n=1 Tax=Lagenidium giganteum TaxID=4803 RepID=A0AAV2YHG1_9STRA|nr:TPA: hypothetical protein N0F65_008150 [Lagenidium giganteum]
MADTSLHLGVVVDATEAALATGGSGSDEAGAHHLDVEGGGSDGGRGSGGKRKRVVLSIHEKQQVLQRLELGEQPVVIARDFGISRQQVSDIKKNKDRILSFCIDAKHLSSLRRKTLRATSEYHPGVEQELYRWLIRQRRLNRLVTSESIAAKTTDLFMQYSADDGSISFKTISNWLRHFKRAHSIKALTPEELAKLSEKFTPCMDMGRSAGDAATTSASAIASSPTHTTTMTPGGYMQAPPAPSTSSTAAAAAAATAAAAAAAGAGNGITVDDVSAYINGMNAPSSVHAHQGFASPFSVNTPSTANVLGSGHMLLSHAINSGSSSVHVPHAQSQSLSPHGARNPFQSLTEMVQEMNHQMSYFEREVSLKLDYMDARMEKLCFQVLPTRFT